MPAPPAPGLQLNLHPLGGRGLPSPNPDASMHKTLNFFPHTKQLAASRSSCVCLFTPNTSRSTKCSIEDFLLARCCDCQSKQCKQLTQDISGRCATFLFLFMLNAAVDLVIGEQTKHRMKQLTYQMEVLHCTAAMPWLLKLPARRRRRRKKQPVRGTSSVLSCPFCL